MKKTEPDGINAIKSVRIRRRNAAAPFELTRTLLTNSRNVTFEHRIQTISERSPAAEEQQPAFAYFDQKAKAVSATGSFNDWRRDATPLKNSGSGEWAVELMLQPDQRECRFAVDNRLRAGLGFDWSLPGRPIE